MGKSKAKKQVKEVYHVEVITSARVVVVESSEDEEYERKKKGKKKKKKTLAKWEYYVKWANYDSDANSWEPEENLEGCERLRESFWRHIGMDDRDYHVGYQVSASHAWIEKEKDFFKREFASAQEEIERHKKVVRDAKKARKRKTETLNQGSIVVSSRSNESSEDERPLQTILISPLKKRKRVVSSPSEDEDTVANSRVQKYAKLNDSRSTAMDVEDTLPRADSPTSLFSAPSSPDVPLIDSFSSPVPTTTTTTTTAANVPSNAKKNSLQPNPHAQSRSEPTSGVGASGISIKQRLGVGALAPTNPKMGPPPRRPMSKPLPPSLASIKIKKRTPSLSINTNANPASGHEQSLRSASITMHSPHPTSNLSPNIPNLSPSTSAPVFTPNFYRHVTPNETFSPPLISQPPAMEEAERFLQEIMPSGLADPILPTQESVVGPPPPMALHPKPALPGRIPKRWQWQGPLYLNASTGLFCSVRIHNSTDPKPSEMRFSVAFEGVTDLSMTTIHNALDLRKILPAFRPWTQLALLSPQEEEDHEPFKILYRHLEDSLKVILRPIILDNNVIGQIFIFSPGLMNILPHLNFPSGFAQPDNLVVALLPYSLSKAQLIKESRLANSEPHSLPTLLESDRWTRSIRIKPGYQHALRILGFPEDLHNYMHDRIFCILWWNRRTSSRNAGLETKLLLNIMEQARAKPAGPSNEARIVFVHVSALTSLHKLPGLVERRSQRPHVQFYTYGSHEDVSPSLWIVKEIYPCGGIITFSPSAMIHNPIEMLHKIKQIIAHPLWECYILPSALGMLAKMVCGDEDPLAVLERGEFSHEFILKAIAAGEMALIHAPPEKATTHSANDLRQIWMRQYYFMTSFTAKRALEIGVHAFHSNYANTSESERSQRMETEILTDLSSMQRQPAIMKDYRRYVVLISEQETRSSSNSGGMEWTTISKFDFSDNFHPNKQIINA